jgi:hypothetical protein
MPCSITGCKEEATHWIDTSEGFTETMLETVEAPGTFYLCDTHQQLAAHDEDGMYNHLRIDEGEIESFEIGVYSCSDKCWVCNH